MNAIKHFVITRIGLGMYDEARLRKVIDLFEAITLSSLFNQSSQEFISLVAIDAHLPLGARERLSALIKERPNYFLVPIDVTRLINVRAGCFDWVWDCCQDFILAKGLLEDPSDYIISSNIDADDAWHRDIVGSINRLFSERLPDLLAMEKGDGRSTWTSHTAGIAATFPQGYQWFVAANAVADMTFPFHSMSVFITARFSSGISACSSRHSQWPEYAKVVQFDVGASKTAPQMWVYCRHDEATVSWNAVQGVPVTPEFEQGLSMMFGVDMEKVQQWRVNYPVTADVEYLGQRTTREQYDLIFRIAALNRKIRAIRSSVDAQNVSAADDELMPCEIEREQLIEKLQG